MKTKIISTIILCLLLALNAMAQHPESDAPSFGELLKMHPWRQARIAYFGDSVTDPNIPSTQKKYWKYLEEWLHATSYVYAVNGRQWDDIPNQADSLNKEHGYQFDAILIFIGTNDYYADRPIGVWYTESKEQTHIKRWHQPRQTVTRLRRHFDYNPQTLKGRINIAMRKIKTMYPDKQVVILTPLHRALFNYKDKNIQLDESYQNGAGLYLDEYVKAIKETQEVWAVPVIDLGNLSGLFPLITEQTKKFNAPGDLLHPNNYGHKIMAQTLLYQLFSLPCRF